MSRRVDAAITGVGPAAEVIGTREITKSFGGVQAVRNVTFGAWAGEVHAIVGENGAGKSTLMRLLGGAVRPDSGSVVLDGRPVDFDDPGAALRAGIRTIHQEFTLLTDLNVVENVYLGAWLHGRAGLLDWPAMRRACGRIFERLGVVISPDALVRDLSVPQQQLVEIAKALSTPARVVIMDEPSAVLAGQDLDQLFGVVRALRAEGSVVVYISHRLPEVFSVADRVTVMRNGETVLVGCPIEGLTPEHLISQMLGRSFEAIPGSRRVPADTPSRLAVEGLEAHGLLHEVDLQVAQGEVVGLAGLVGAGRTSLLRTLFGAGPRDAGTVTVDGRAVPPGDVAAAMRAGIALVPEDRKAQGLVLPFSIRENVSLAALERITRLGALVRSRERELATQAIARLDIRASSVEQPVEQLSGGNQQKVSLGKWISRQPRVLLLDEPTRGVDVGAKAEIHGQLRAFAAAGMAILVASSELSELFALCDRILVMRDGRIVAAGRPGELREEEVLAAAVSHEVVHRATAPAADAPSEALAGRPVAAMPMLAPSGAVTALRRVAASLRGDRAAAAIWVVLVLCSLGVGLVHPEFWDPANLANVIRQASVLGVVALGQSLVILSGGIDLSVAGIVKLTSLIGAGVMAGQLANVPLAVAAMVAIAVVVGLGNGVVASWLGASPFIVTLGMLLALQGISLTYAPSSVGSVPAEIVNLYDASIGPLPLAGAVLLVAFVVTWFGLQRTTWGRSIYAAGGNAIASRLAGISVTRTQMSTYVLTALLCVIAALIILSRSGVGDPQTGDGLELSSITAVVLGGTSLFGGRGALLGTLGGVLLLAVISTSLDLLQVPSYYQSLVSGLVIIVAIAAPRRAR